MKKLRKLFPILYITACILACGLVGNGLYYCIVDFRSGIPPGIWFIRLAFLVLLLACAGLLYRKYALKYGVTLKVWFVAFLAVVLAGAGADSWQAWLESFPGQGVRLRLGPVVYLLLLLLTLAYIEYLLQDMPPRSLVDIRNAVPEPRAHLVLFLSNIRLDVYPAGAPDWLQGTDRDLARDLERLADEKRTAIHHTNGASHWAWEQALRAIHHHRKDKSALKSVTVIASCESILQVPLFASVLAKYPVLKEIDFKLLLNTSPSKECRRSPLESSGLASQGFNFEDFTQVSGALRSLILELTKSPLSESDIMIDFTGGKKVTSVVAAAMTFNTSIEAQYIQTECPWNVLSYKVIIPSKPI